MKQTIRRNMLKARMSLSDIAWKQKSCAIFKNICQIKNFTSSKNILIFMDFRKEVYTKPIIDWIMEHNKQAIIPRVNPNSDILELCIIKDYTDMDISDLGIREPKSSHTNFAKPEDIDLVIIPGVAFTTDGGRLGYGGGYYDRLIPLMSKKPLLIAPAFELQIVEQLPLEQHDIRIDMIVTESRIIDCNR